MWLNWEDWKQLQAVTNDVDISYISIHSCDCKVANFYKDCRHPVLCVSVLLSNTALHPHTWSFQPSNRWVTNRICKVCSTTEQFQGFFVLLFCFGECCGECCLKIASYCATIIVYIYCSSHCARRLTILVAVYHTVQYQFEMIVRWMYGKL